MSSCNMPSRQSRSSGIHRNYTFAPPSTLWWLVPSSLKFECTDRLPTFKRWVNQQTPEAWSFRLLVQKIILFFSLSLSFQETSWNALLCSVISMFTEDLSGRCTYWQVVIFCCHQIVFSVDNTFCQFHPRLCSKYIKPIWGFLSEFCLHSTGNSDRSTKISLICFDKSSREFKRFSFDVNVNCCLVFQVKTLVQTRRAQVTGPPEAGKSSWRTCGSHFIQVTRDSHSATWCVFNGLFPHSKCRLPKKETQSLAHKGVALFVACYSAWEREAGILTDWGHQRAWTSDCCWIHVADKCIVCCSQSRGCRVGRIVCSSPRIYNPCRRKSLGTDLCTKPCSSTTSCGTDSCCI